MAFVVTAITSSAAVGDGEEVKLSRDEQAIVDLTNKARAKKKLPPLKVNAVLMKAARGHSTNMASRGIYNHVIDSKDAGKRLDGLGYMHVEWGENIYLE